MEVGVLRTYADWLADAERGLNTVLAAVPLDADDPDDQAPPAVPLIVDETRTPWAALGVIPDEVVAAHGRVLVLNVVGDTDFAARTEQTGTGDTLQVAVRVAAPGLRDEDGTLVDTDAVVAELYRTLHAVRFVLSERFREAEEGGASLTRAGATLDEPPSFSRGQVAPDKEASSVLVAAMLISQPVHYPWPRAGL